MALRSCVVLVLAAAVVECKGVDDDMEKASSVSLLQTNLNVKHMASRPQRNDRHCVPWDSSYPQGQWNDTLLDPTCAPLQRPPATDDTQSLCLCRQTAPSGSISALIDKHQCPDEPTLSLAFKQLDILNITLNPDFIALNHRNRDNSIQPKWARGLNSEDGEWTPWGFLRFDIADDQIDISPKDWFTWWSENIIDSTAGFPKMLLDVAKEVRLPNISFLLSTADGSPSHDAAPLPLVDNYKVANLGVWRTEGRPGLDILSIPRSLSDWGATVRSKFNLKPNTSYTPKALAVFRGSDTDSGGWRQQIRKLALKRPDLIDAGVDRLTDEQQMRFPVVLAPDGKSLPDRLPRQMSYGVPIVFIHPLQSVNEFWYPDLVPWVHYVPSSGADLEEALETLRDNPALAQSIGLNGKRFIEERFTERRLRCYVYRLLEAYSARFHP